VLPSLLSFSLSGRMGWHACLLMGERNHHILAQGGMIRFETNTEVDEILQRLQNLIFVPAISLK